MKNTYDNDDLFEYYLWCLVLSDDPSLISFY